MTDTNEASAESPEAAAWRKIADWQSAYRAVVDGPLMPDVPVLLRLTAAASLTMQDLVVLTAAAAQMPRECPRSCRQAGPAASGYHHG